tara:strand:- start:163 stop:1449 length:1287 start_codon:yes stop_codon:yes gene_type:complete
MISKKNLKNLSFLIYGLGLTGKSVVNFFIKNNIRNFKVWDDHNKELYKKNRASNLLKALYSVDYIILSPGVSLAKSKNKNNLIKFKKKIITDLDLFFLVKKFSKSIVITGTNGKSTTSKILSHVLKKNHFQPVLGGNIGAPVLSLKIKKKNTIIIEASSFQLSYSKFIYPDYAILLNISNDHLDWHVNMKDYINSKFKIFENQNKRQFALVNINFKNFFKKKKLSGKLKVPNLKKYITLKSEFKNNYLKLNMNDENMSFVYELTKLLKIRKRSFLNSLNTFVGLPHRYEIFMKRNNCTFINDSKATSFQSTKFALKNSKNIFWILGGMPKKNDKIILRGLKKNILRSYIIGKNINFFKKQIKGQIKFCETRTIRKSIIKILKDIRTLKKQNNTILLSPSSASYDQYSNFEKRGDEFKKLSKLYARKYF